MLLRFVALFLVALFAFASTAEPAPGGSPPPPPPNGTMMEPLLGNGTEPNGPPPPMDGMNGTDVQENGNKTGGGMMDWIKSKLGK